MPFEKDFPLERYLFDEFSPRRIVWEVTLKSEADAWADLIFQREETGTEKLLEGGGMMAMMSVPEEHADHIWLYLDPQNEQITFNIFAPAIVSNVEVYACTDLISGVWTVAEQNLHPAGPTNPAVWDAASEWTNRFFAAGNMDIDSDGDGLPDARERFVYKTNPDNADSDGDGLNDGVEVQTYGTNPLSSDTDNDGLPDGWEVQYGLDPLDAEGSNGGAGDFDSDGASNYTEYQRGTDPADEHSVTRETSLWEPFVVDAHSLARSSNILFVAGNTDLYAFDISDPLTPGCLSVTNLSVFSYPKLAAVADYVYACASRETGLHLFDYSNPSAPQYAGQIILPAGKTNNYWGFNNLLVQDGYLYVWDNAIEIYSLTNPASPQWIGSIPDISTETNSLDVCGLYVDGDILYAGYRSKGFSVWNITNRSVPELEVLLSSTNSAYEFMRQGNCLYVLEYNEYESETEGWVMYSRIAVLDFSGGFPTDYVPQMTLNYDWRYYSPRHLVADGPRMYAYDNDNASFLTYDVSAPAIPCETNVIAFDYGIDDMELCGSTMYLAAANNGLAVLDLSNPSSPVVRGEIGSVEGNPVDATGNGDAIYVCRSGGGISELNAANPAQLYLTSEIFATSASGVSIAEGRASVAMGYNGMSVFDLAATNPPIQLSSIDTALPLESITVQGDYAYCGSRSGQALVTLDCSDPANPQEVYTNNSLGYIDRLILSDGRLYAASFDQGLLISSLTNAAQPELIGQLNTRSCFRDVAVGGSNLVYAADGINGLLVIDITDPAQPVQISQLKLDYGRRLALSGNRVCLIGYKTIYFIDVSNPQQPVLQQEVSFGLVEPIAVCTTDGLFHVLDKSTQLHTYFIP
jgi:hypothetical protein